MTTSYWNVSKTFNYTTTIIIESADIFMLYNNCCYDAKHEQTLRTFTTYVKNIKKNKQNNNNNKNNMHVRKCKVQMCKY